MVDVMMGVLMLMNTCIVVCTGCCSLGRQQLMLLGPNSDWASFC